tara:strand:+ start:575 stop:1003 length:429 start_codon:yes stop_codon:yes gene_type:complete
MTLVNARAAIETAIKTSVNAADNTVSVIFDNMPFTTPGKNKKYVMVNINFNQATAQPQGAAQTYYQGSVRCGVMTPPHKGSAVASAVSESVITGLTSINASNYVDTFSCSPRVTQIVGPTAVTTEGDSHFLSVVSCNFSANG